MKLISSISGTYSNGSFTHTTGIRSSVLDTTNLDFIRIVKLSDEGISISRGNTQVAIAMSELYGLFAKADPNITWAPIVSVNPSNASCVHSSTAANFNITATAETTITYQWQYSADGSTGWTNASGTVNGCTYTNDTTNVLTCTPTTTGQNGYYHRCQVTNATGTTNSNSAILTIT